MRLYALDGVDSEEQVHDGGSAMRDDSDDDGDDDGGYQAESSWR